MGSVVESTLNVGRLARTFAAARQFHRQPRPPRATPGRSYWNMRQAMSLDPRIGKFVSRHALRPASLHGWIREAPQSTRFVDAQETQAALSGLRRNGFYVFAHVVDGAIVQQLRSFAEQVPCSGRGLGGPKGTYPRSNPQVGRYDISEEDALASPEVQEFATDPVMGYIAQQYLDQPVIMDEVAFWWTTNRRAEDANLNAQLFHQDRDRLSFLKYFIYLTDVTPDTGPHVYLRGSHRRIPWSMRDDGRVSDEVVRAAGLWSDVVEITGPAGTLMAVDTIGLHKGKTPLTGDRLALENEFATSLFGMEYDLPDFLPSDLVRQRYANYPFMLQRYEHVVGNQ